MFEAAIQREHKKALKLGIMKGKQEGLREGELKGLREGKQEGLREGELIGKQGTIASLLKQGVISQEQARQALRGLL